MFMSKEEFEEMIKTHPTLKIQGQNPADLSCQQRKTSGDRKPPVGKYRNVKVYIFEDGFASENRNESNHGKPVSCFDSRKEYARYLQLAEMESAGGFQNWSVSRR